MTNSKVFWILVAAALALLLVQHEARIQRLEADVKALSILSYRYFLAGSCFVALLSWAVGFFDLRKIFASRKISCQSYESHRLPLFGCYLAVQLPLLVGYRPEDDAWLATWWLYLQPLVLVARAGATWEAYWVHSSEYAERRVRVFMGACLCLLAVAMVMAGWFYRPTSTVQGMVQARRLVLIACVAFLGAYILPMAFKGMAGTGWRSKHIWLYLGMLLVMLGAAFPSMGLVRHGWDRAMWHAIDNWANGVTAGLLLVWAIMFWREYGREQRSPSAR